MQPTRDRDTSNREVAHSEGSTLQINTDRGPNLRVQPISAANMHVIFFAGLRGAVAFALAYIFPNEEGNRQLVLCTTAFVIVITIIVMGGLTEPLIHLVGVKTGVDKDEYIQVPHKTHLHYSLLTLSLQFYVTESI